MNCFIQRLLTNPAGMNWTSKFLGLLLLQKLCTWILLQTL